MSHVRLKMFMASFGLLLSLNSLNTPALAVECKNSDDCLKRGLESQTKGRHTEAIDYLNTSLALFPDEPDPEQMARVVLALAENYVFKYAQTRDIQYLKLAEEEYQTVTKLAPDWYAGYSGLALIAANHNQHEESLKLYNKSIELAPKNPMSHFNRARYFSFTSRNTEALDGINTAIGLLSQYRFNQADKSYVLEEDEVLNQVQLIDMYTLRVNLLTKLGKADTSNEDQNKLCSLGVKRFCKS